MAQNLANYANNPNYGLINGAGQVYDASGNTLSIWNAKLSATTDTTLVVPGGTGIGRLANNTNLVLALFSYAPSANTSPSPQVFVKNNATALPTLAASFTQDNTVLNPVAMLVRYGDTLHFYAILETKVTVEFRAVQA